MHKEPRNLETVSHLFQELSRIIWEKVRTWIAAEAVKPINWGQTTDIGQWFIELGNSSQQQKKEGFRSVVILILWEIWKK